MLFSIRKVVLACVAICLIVLQLLLPFVHAHLDHGGSSQQASGLHVHIAGAEIVQQSAYEAGQYPVDIHAYQNQHSQLVAIDKGLFKEVDLPDFMAFVFILIVFSTVLLPAFQQVTYPRDSFKVLQYFYNSFSTRAPPCC